jgi:hypothetical protein
MGVAGIVIGSGIIRENKNINNRNNMGFWD